MNVDFDCTGQTLTAKLTGDIDHHSACLMRTEIDYELMSKRPERLILDMTGIKFMDSSGLGLILGRVRTAGTFGCTVTVRSEAGGQMSRIIKMAGADRLVRVEEAGHEGNQ